MPEEHLTATTDAQLASEPPEIAAIRQKFLAPETAEGLIVRGQLRQDLLALVVNGFKPDGYFVEFGATNGEKYSNSNLLELHFGWKGILSEPAVGWHAKLRRKRNCIIDTRCVWRTTGEQLEFDMADSRTLSTLAQFADSDHHAEKREKAERIIVETVSLVDLLAQHNAPAFIDYLSVDTEGSEFEILNAFDFSRHRFGLITVEHNFTEQRAQIHALLTANGYQRILTDLSKFDDWYIPKAAE
ncbi:FkbM family methyltransferase [Pseudoruegeria sp. SHC-113]|uniref:FkbM family methyltransferase n=1 Tax=Pseudoruegeria sp. SHC-113 TaxID=2855439 RepID=UPI0021BA4225|nr:FkbM family methyltransferase [Pseudoruegeria sp. SHC-113]MCT8159161.1 FkbM family methyltransferase [Pseudoruegeria sp. SHC-113]